MFWPSSVEDPFVGKEKEGAAVEARPRMTVAEGLFAADAAKRGGTKRKAATVVEDRTAEPEAWAVEELTAEPEALAVEELTAEPKASGDPKVVGRKVRMPQRDIDSIMAMAWGGRVHTRPHNFDDLPEEERKRIENLIAIEDDFYEMKDEMCRDLDDKGYYDVDVSYYEQRAELQAIVKDHFANIDWASMGITFTDDDDGVIYPSDLDDDDEY